MAKRHKRFVASDSDSDSQTARVEFGAAMRRKERASKEKAREAK